MASGQEPWAIYAIYKACRRDVRRDPLCPGPGSWSEDRLPLPLGTAIRGRCLLRNVSTEEVPEHSQGRLTPTLSGRDTCRVRVQPCAERPVLVSWGQAVNAAAACRWPADPAWHGTGRVPSTCESCVRTGPGSPGRLGDGRYGRGVGRCRRRLPASTRAVTTGRSSRA